MKTTLHTITRRLLMLALLLAAIPASAYDFMVDGIAYSVNSDFTTVTVVQDNQNHPTYSGDIVLPDVVNNDGKDYTVVAIGKQAFLQCRNLTSITLPESLQLIDNNAFFDCSGLASIVVPNSVEEINQGAFKGCTGLESIVLPASLNNLNNYLFAGCKGLKSIQLPLSLKHIYSSAFDGCSSIKIIEIPNSVESIGSYAFRNCTSLEEITIGESLKYISKDAFDTNCPKLKKVRWNVIDFDEFQSRDDNPFYILNFFRNNITSFEFGNKVRTIPSFICSQFSNLEAINLPQLAESIGDEAFVLCRTVTSVHLPKAVNSIGDYAFAQCEALTSIVCDIIDPHSITCADSAFSMIDKAACTLYVPQGTLASYKAKAPWSDFLNIIEFENADVNMDGAVTSADVTVLYNHLLGHENMLTYACDINHDGAITSSDVTAVYEVMLGGEEDSDITTYTVNGVSFNMIKVKGGTFMMGCDDDDNEASDYDKPAHQVTLDDYSIGQTEVTQELWRAVMGINSTSMFQGNKHPVENVSRYQCELFVDKLNQLTGLNFRLPTEAEWEYAACGGSKSKGFKYSGSDNLEAVAWYYSNSYFQDSTNPDFGTHAVGLKEPNELGAYDMSGNVYEWCIDFANHYKPEPQTNPVGDEFSNNFIMRGGSWDSTATKCRAKIRNSQSNSGSWLIGLRLAL